MTYGELKKKLKKNKCSFHHQGGNHEVWISEINGNEFSVGRHNKQEVKDGTLNSILKRAGLK